MEIHVIKIRKRAKYYPYKKFLIILQDYYFYYYNIGINRVFFKLQILKSKNTQQKFFDLGDNSRD